jgi:hypothetical protein
MTRDTQAVRRSEALAGARAGARWRLATGLLTALAVAAVTGAGCTPDIPSQPVPAFVELQFDPSSTPPKSYEPTLLITNAETGLLDFSAAGIEIPADVLECQTQTALSLAACEFYWYMEGLDGFPTLTPARTPVSAPIDLATATVPGNVFIYEFLRGQSPFTDIDVTYDADTGYLVADPATGWDINGLYFVAVRGYAGGVKDTAGNEAVKSIIYVLLQQDNPLTCGVTSVDDPALEDCAYYGLFTGDARFNTLPPAEMKPAIYATLAQLEQLRALYKGESELPFSVWDQVDELGQMPANEVGILWAFRTHTASVIESNPAKGLGPVIPNPRQVRIGVKGQIQADTLTSFGLANSNGSVFLLDGTAFAAGNIAVALPNFTTTFTGSELVLDVDSDLVEGDQYVLLFTTQVEGKPGVPLVPSPVTVFLRTRGELVEDYAVCGTDPTAAVPLVPGLKGPDACQLEAGRTGLLALLDDPLVATATAGADRPNGLQREMIAYIYGFTYTAQ